MEGFCPMGGLATLPKVISAGRAVCAVGEAALAALVALVVLSLLARKAFCGWFCPVGLVAEWLGRLGARVRGKKCGVNDYGMLRPAQGVDWWLRWVRLVVLALVVIFTWQASELVFRPFCPYYLMTGFVGHDIASWSYPLLALVLLATTALPLLWCRYLCPLGGAIWPLSGVGLLRLDRRPEVCNDCRLCDRTCPQGLRPSAVKQVTSGECLLCLRCLNRCPRPGALVLTACRKWKVPGAVVPGLVVVLALFAGLGSSWVWIASYEWESSAPQQAATEQVQLRVQGVKCAHSGKKAAAQLEKIPGVQRIEVFASRGILRVSYDSTRLDERALRQALEAPLLDQESGSLHFGVFKVIDVTR